MRIDQISFSRWGENDSDLSGLRLKNMAGEESGDLGSQKYEWETVALKQTPIEKITVYKKNEAYMKGFLIYYRNGEQQVINDDGG